LILRSFTRLHDMSYRRARVTIAEKEALAQDTEEALKKKELESEERRKQSHDLVAESIRRELAESECFFTCLVIYS
jgi:microfibrillar-associated protein 1